MKRLNTIILTVILSVLILAPYKKTFAATQSPISRSAAEQRALNIINLNWTYSSVKNSTLPSTNGSSVTQPSQLKNVSTATMTGIPYDWGGLDSLDTSSDGAPWTSFVNAINSGAFAGNVNTSAPYGYIKGTAGIDCSGFVQAVFDINDYKQSTSTLLNSYFTKINLSDLKHMDILDHPGDHVVIFDKWGTLNGVQGAFTYESTPDQTYGGIQGTKKYFITMSEINSGYIPGRYVNIIEDSSNPDPMPVSDSYGIVSNVVYAANFRSDSSTSSAIIGTIPKNTVLKLLASNSGWYNVIYNGQTGWIYSSLITSVPSNSYVTVNNVYQLNIRSNPSSTASILGVLTEGQYAKVTGISTDGNWYKININGVEGFSAVKYLKYIN
ncbi:SH3 domain-containing protein [Clostridium neuense]|uniref:SH3 domain-containing protein n=1 Tax=Clostridium neuense TaxID=1728934 RepID=A0ABW8TQ72_9CLOT